MKKKLSTSNTPSRQPDSFPSTPATGGLRVRTNLRAGLAWDDLDDQAAALWSKLTNSIASLTNSSSSDSGTTTT
jgi:hypothetical protein